jgi:hypothetical protein
MGKFAPKFYFVHAATPLFRARPFQQNFYLCRAHVRRIAFTELAHERSRVKPELCVGERGPAEAARRLVASASAFVPQLRLCFCRARAALIFMCCLIL